ncbi:MAG: cellulase family glycosylhydrolase [Deltaproteobacteria bacterium]|nr:cellulase family glycosylhydrolase [Deltaproteobacteria bacterium]
MKGKVRYLLVFAFCMFFTLFGCSSSDLERLTASFSDPDPKSINKAQTGVNNFFVYNEFGSMDAQYADIKNTLGLKYVRVLFAWTDDVQRNPNDQAFVGFYDEIVSKVPAGVDILIVVAHTPSWMTNSANWISGNPRRTFVDRWLKPLLKRYAGNPRIVGWEIWNEPDLTVVPSDSALGLEQAENYYELLQMGASAVRTYDPGKKVVIAATESINQKYPNNLNYNKRLDQLGATAITDVWNIHYYSKNYDTVVVSGGISDFLNGLGLPIWITESGRKEPVGQLDYVQRAWPFLQQEVSSIERFYYYEYASPSPLAENFGLRTTDAANPISDLYVWLRSN